MRRWTLAALAACCLIAGGLLIAWEIRGQNVRELRAAERLLVEFDAASQSGADTALPYKRVVTLLAAMMTSAARANAREMEGIAELLVDRIVSDQSLSTLPLWTAALEDVQGAIPEDSADRLASKLTGRIEREPNTALLYPLVAALNVLADRVSSRQAGTTGRALILRMEEGELPHLTAGAAGLAALEDKLPVTALDNARAVLLNALRKENNPTSMAALGLSLGSLAQGVAAGGFDEAIHIEASRMAAQTGVYELFGLASAIRSLTEVGMSPQAAALDAGLLVERLQRERQIPEFMRVGLGLEVLAPNVSVESAPPLVARLLERMESSTAPSIVRALAFNIGDFNGARTDQIHRASALLRQRILVEPDASILRLLVAGLINLGDRVPEEFREEAARQAETLRGAADSDSQVDLDAILRALREDEGKDEHDEDEEMADFHTLLVADDDGEIKAEEEASGGAGLVPVQGRDLEVTPALIIGIGLLIAGLVLAGSIAAGFRRVV